MVFHYLAPSCTILHHLAPSCNILHHLAPSCTILHHLAPPCTTLTTCIEKLSECFGGDDVEQMRATTETDQKAFLVRIMDGKVTAEAANRCGVKVEKKTVPIPPVVMMGGPGSEPPILPIGSAVDKLHHQLQGGAVFNSVVEEEEEVEPPIADVMAENQPPIGDIMEEDEDAGLGGQMGWESL